MNILYVSTLCSDEMFKRIYDNSDIKPQQQTQKFHSLLSKGLANPLNDVNIMSRLPLNKTTDKKLKSNFSEKNENITYQYIKTMNNQFFNHIYVFIVGFVSTLKWSAKFKKNEKVVFCDVLNLSISLSALFASKISGVKNVAIVTDIPSYMQNYNSNKKTISKKIVFILYTKISEYYMKKYDAYTILTYQMNCLVNPKRKPSVIIEGMVDDNMREVSNSYKQKYVEKVIIYAGSLKEKAGIRKLIEAFIKLESDEARLWLYGSGEMEEDIKAYQRIDNRIKYFGVVPNQIVVKEQLKATLLVNPRPSEEEFTKYSFPSKNMEYMASGTPVLTTPLQGMPKEYNNYVYLFDDETIEGMTKTIESLLKIDKSELHAKGIRAKEFVMKEKNNIVQANKIIQTIVKECINV